MRLFNSIIGTIIFLFISCNSNHQKYDQIKEPNIEIVKLYVEEIWNKRNLSVADSIIGNEFVDPASATGESGPTAFKEIVSSYLVIFPDIKLTIDDLVADDDKVAWKWTAQGTHESEIWGIAPTYKRVSFSGIIIDQIKDGRIINRWGTYDRLSLKEQLIEK